MEVLQCEKRARSSVSTGHYPDMSFNVGIPLGVCAFRFHGFIPSYPTGSISESEHCDCGQVICLLKFSCAVTIVISSQSHMSVLRLLQEQHS